MGFVSKIFGGGGGGGTTVNVPGPTAEETELTRTQTEILNEQLGITRDQLEQADILNPLLFAQLGIDAEFDPEGKLLSVTEDPQAQATRDLRSEIESESLTRELAALRGEGEIDPSLTRSFEEGEETLRESLLKQLGPGCETSTPGIEALANFQQRKTETEFGARRGDLSLFEQLALSSQAGRQGQGTDTLNKLLGISGIQTGNVGQLGQIAQGFGGIGASLQGDRAMRNQANIASIGARGEARAGLFGGIGALLGPLLGNQFPQGLSDISLKEDIELLGKSPSGINIYSFKYIGEEDNYQGVMAQEVPWASTPDEKGYYSVDYSKLDVEFIKLN